MTAILRDSDLDRLTGISRTTRWRLERNQKFPARIRLSPNSVGWLEEEVLDWIASRPRGMAASETAPAPTTDQRGARMP